MEASPGWHQEKTSLGVLGERRRTAREIGADGRLPGNTGAGCFQSLIGMNLQIWTCSHFASVTEVMDFFLSPLHSMDFPTGRDTELHI